MLDTAVPSLAPTTDPAWLLVEEGFTLVREHELESQFAIANGYLGSRGSLAEGCPLSAPATYIAGVFDAEPGSVPHLVEIHDWCHLSVSICGQPLRLDVGRTLEHRRILDMRQAILWRFWRHEDKDGRITRIRSFRFASQADRHLLVHCVEITPENYSGPLLLDASLAASATQTTHEGVSVSVALANRVLDPDGRVIGSTELLSGNQPFRAKRGSTYRLERVAAVYTSRETDRPNEAAQRHAEDALNRLTEIIADHQRAWQIRWHASDVRIEGAPEDQRALRFAAYHLLSCANPDDERVSIGARGLSGPGYKGHVLWDTEIFMLPFFTLTWPEAARAMLMYRYHTLPAARANAARLGYSGALYAWESAATGEDVTPSFVGTPEGEVIRILTGEQEHHISADVAYAVWQYWDATRDDRFLLDAGLEILIETARFWASRVVLEEDGRYHIRCVIGPDEYHESVDDNAYTNGMAQWNLETAANVAERCAVCWPEEWQAIGRRIAVSEEEIQSWRNIARDIYTGFDERTGLFEQFRGYFELEDIDLSRFANRIAPMDVILGRENIAKTKIIKQPDVVMLVYLLWDRLPAEVRKANFEYYEPRCGHGSSLSPAIHAVVAARLGNMALAEHYFRQTAEIDLANNMGNSAAGVHMAALGGLWQSAVFGFAGLHLGESEPRFQPNLPESWRRLSMRFQWRNNWFDVALP